MIRKRRDMHAETFTNVKGGTGSIEMVNILEADELYGAGRFFGLSIIPPGGCTGPHPHDGDFETYYILRGKARINDSGTFYDLEPGDMAQCPSGGFHAIENIGTEDLEYFSAILYTKQR